MSTHVTLKSRPQQPQSNSGFSLLEILVVLIVIVIITSTVTLTVSSGGEDVVLEAQVRTLADVAEFALDEAQMTGENYGLFLSETFEDGEALSTYEWFRRDLEGWVPLGEQEVFKTALLPPGIELELELPTSASLDTEIEGDEDEEEERILPQLMFYASGEMTEGALNIRRSEDSELLWRLEWDLLGRFDVMRRGEPEPEAF